MASGFRVMVAGTPTDLDDLLEPGSGGSSTGFRVGGTDLNARYDQSVGGDQLAFDTGFRIAGSDLKNRFKKLLTVPVIISQPSAYSGNEGTDYTLSVTADGAPTLTYDWQKSDDGSTGWTSVSPGNGSSSYTKTNPPPLNIYYRCAVTNSYGTTYTNVVNVVVYENPGITSQPSDINAPTGSLVAFQVSADGAQTLYFEWFKDGASLNSPRAGNLSSTSDQHVFTLDVTTKGSYYCRVTNSHGGTAAQTVTVTATVT